MVEVLSTLMAAPLICRASSDAKNAITSATAPGSQAKEAACIPMSSLICGGEPAMFITIGVMIPSGCTELQRSALPCCFRYTAVLMVKLLTAAFDAV